MEPGQSRYATSAYLESGLQESTNESCGICRNSFLDDDPSASSCCGHYFHFDCMLEWGHRGLICPVCRTTPVTLEPPSREELLFAVQRDRRNQVAEQLEIRFLRHPDMGEFLAQHIPLNGTQAHLDKLIWQRLSTSALMMNVLQVSRSVPTAREVFSFQPPPAPPPTPEDDPSSPISPPMADPSSEAAGTSGASVPTSDSPDTGIPASDTIVGASSAAGTSDASVPTSDRPDAGTGIPASDTILGASSAAGTSGASVPTSDSPDTGAGIPSSDTIVEPSSAAGTSGASVLTSDSSDGGTGIAWSDANARLSSGSGSYSD